MKFLFVLYIFIHLFFYIYSEDISPSFSQCIYDDLMGDICLSFTWIDDCDIEIIATNNNTQLYEEVTTIQNLGQHNTLRCSDTLPCTLCYQWIVSLDNEGGATADAILTGSCLANDITFNIIIPHLRLCSLPCPDSCAGHGSCQNSGMCDCGQGYYGLDCSLSSGCESTRDSSIDRITDITLQKTLNSGEIWKGYVIGYKPLAELEVIITPIDSHPINIWSMKSCKPNPELQFYDDRYTNAITIISIDLVQNCDLVDGGTWFFEVSCSNINASCSFSIEYEENIIKPLEYDTPSLFQVDDWNTYFEFEVIENSNSSYIHIETTEIGNCTDLNISLLPLTCPTNSLAFIRLINEPLVFTNINNDKICKYILSISDIQEGLWNMRFSTSDITNNNIWVSLTLGHCDSICNNGYCASNSSCVCYNSWTGELCDIPFQFEDDTDINNNTQNNSLSTTELIAIIIGIIVVGIIIILVVGIIAKFIITKRRRQNPKDTLFTMLAQEQDLDDMI